MMKLTYLDLSTGHLSKQTMELLERAGDRTQVATETAKWPAMTIAAYAHGMFVTVPDPDVSYAQYGEMPSDLADVVHHAQVNGINLLRFDSDGDWIKGLPTFEW